MSARRRLRRLRAYHDKLLEQGAQRPLSLYFCQNKACPSCRKSVRREEIEGAFEDLLTAMRPSEDLFHLSLQMFSDLWALHRQKSDEGSETMRDDLRKIERMSEQLLDRIVETDNPALVKVYEDKLGKLEKNKILMREAIGKCGRKLESFEDTYRTALWLLANPQKLWNSERMEHKRTVLKLAFADRLLYCRKEGYRTATPALPTLLLQKVNGNMGENSGQPGLPAIGNL